MKLPAADQVGYPVRSALLEVTGIDDEGMFADTAGKDLAIPGKLVGSRGVHHREEGAPTAVHLVVRHVISADEPAQPVEDLRGKGRTPAPAMEGAHQQRCRSEVTWRRRFHAACLGV